MLTNSCIASGHFAADSHELIAAVYVITFVSMPGIKSSPLDRGPEEFSSRTELYFDHVFAASASSKIANPKLSCCYKVLSTC